MEIMNIQKLNLREGKRGSGQPGASSYIRRRWS